MREQLHKTPNAKMIHCVDCWCLEPSSSRVLIIQRKLGTVSVHGHSFSTKDSIFQRLKFVFVCFPRSTSGHVNSKAACNCSDLLCDNSVFKHVSPSNSLMNPFEMHFVPCRAHPVVFCLSATLDWNPNHDGWCLNLLALQLFLTFKTRIMNTGSPSKSCSFIDTFVLSFAVITNFIATKLLNCFLLLQTRMPCSWQDLGTVEVSKWILEELSWNPGKDFAHWKTGNRPDDCQFARAPGYETPTFSEAQPKGKGPTRGSTRRQKFTCFLRQPLRLMKQFILFGAYTCSVNILNRLSVRLCNDNRGLCLAFVWHKGKKKCWVEWSSWTLMNTDPWKESLKTTDESKTKVRCSCARVLCTFRRSIRRVRVDLRLKSTEKMMHPANSQL